MPLFGAHMSVAGGVHLALDHMTSAGAESLQIFTKNQRRWESPPLTEGDAALYREKWEKAGRPPVASHASYLVNIATADPALAAKSEANLADELERCAMLGVPYLVLHPGSHGGDGTKAGISRAAASLDSLFAKTGEISVTILLENTAGQGSWLGSDFAELGSIISRSENPGLLGICLDTAHAFAAGYELRTEEGYGAAMDSIDREVGLSRLLWFHLNDSLGALGSHKDRHTHIGDGELGLEGFRRLVNDPRFASRPMALETPKEDDLEDDRRNLATLRKLLDKQAPKAKRTARARTA